MILSDCGIMMIFLLLSDLRGNKVGKVYGKGLKQSDSHFCTNQHMCSDCICVCVAELTPTWTQTRLWPTWLDSAQGNCPAIGFCSQPDRVSGASHSEQRVTLARVKPTLALDAVQVHWPLFQPPSSRLHWHWAYTGNALRWLQPRPHNTLDTKKE